MTISKLFKDLVSKKHSQNTPADDSVQLSAATQETQLKLSEVLPALPRSHSVILSDVILSILERNEQSDGNVPLTPFTSAPYVTISSPDRIVKFLKESGAKIPTAINPNEYKTPSIGSLSELSGISGGSLSSVASGRQHLSSAHLEGIRLSLAKIGRANNIEEFAALSDPTEFLKALVSEYLDLESSTPKHRIVEWAQELINEGNLDADTAKTVLSEMDTVTPVHYLKSVLSIWRAQIDNGELENFSACKNLMEVLSTRTKSRRFNRGFQHMTAAVHQNTPDFNERIKYPKSYYAEYRRRYSAYGEETGLTSEALLGYCFYTGINPVSMLRWLALSEIDRPGSYNAAVSKSASTANGLVCWQGTMSPKEYDRFISAIGCLGIVSDDRRWQLALHHSKYVFASSPCRAEINSVLGRDRHYQEPIVEQYFDGFDASLTLQTPDGFSSFMSAAESLGALSFFTKDNDLAMLVCFLCGLTKDGFNQGVEAEIEGLDHEGLYTYAINKLLGSMTKVNEENYLHSSSAPGKSCRCASFVPRDLVVADQFYLGLSSQFVCEVSTDDEDDDLLSLIDKPEEW